MLLLRTDNDGLLFKYSYTITVNAKINRKVQNGRKIHLFIYVCQTTIREGFGRIIIRFSKIQNMIEIKFLFCSFETSLNSLIACAGIIDGPITVANR